MSNGARPVIARDARPIARPWVVCAACLRYNTRAPGARRERDDVAYVVGNSVDGYCKNCRTDTSQTVLEVDGHRIRLVRCPRCHTEGPFLSPRARTKAGLREVAAKRRTRAPAKRSRRKDDPAAVFRRLLAGKDPAEAVGYDAAQPLDVGQLVDHPTFGIGVVIALPEPTKANVAFEDRARVMVCNRK
jgi:hypothetical protein